MKNLYLLFLSFFVFLQSIVSQSIKTSFRLRIPNGIPSNADVRITGNVFGQNGQPMLHLGGGIYEYELQSSCGKRVSYSFLINGIGENITAGCCINLIQKRQIVIPDSDTILPITCFGSCDSCESGVLVTFRVSLGTTTPAPQGVFLTGSFNNWSTTSLPMTFDSINGFYIVQITLSPNSFIEYKFLNGSSYEQLSGPCASGPFGNRTLTVPQNDTILPAVCFGSCNPCPAPPPPAPTSQVTFRVNLGSTPASPAGVHIAGNFQGWNPAATPMTFDSAGGFWKYTATLNEGDTIQYKFINGNAWGADETVPAACGIGSPANRFVVVPVNDTTLPAVCFGSCNPCPAPPPPAPTSQVTFRVNLGSTPASPAGVHIAGNFQGWNPAATPMTFDSAGGFWKYTATLNEGDTIQYKFINGNAWGADETVPAACGIGNPSNRFVVVPVNDTTLPAVCFGSCNPCPAPPPPAPTSQVTFRVNLGSTPASPAGVHIAGNFQGWNPAATPMTFDSAGGFWKYTATLNEGDTIQYKFINGNAWGADETVPAACGIGNPSNRFLIVPVNDTTLPAVCFGSCNPCPAPPPPAPTSQVTFRVNLGSTPASPAGVHIAGNFQGWNPAATPMTFDSAGGFWKYTATLNEGDTIQYKFINGNAWGADETVPAACGIGNPSNRFLIVPVNDTTLPAVCFGSCNPCPSLPPAPSTSDVTFQVNMKGKNVSPEGVHVAGTFNQWNYSQYKMTQIQPNIYRITIPIDTGAFILYKFSNGSSFTTQELITGSCTQFGNRFLTIPANDTTLPAVCFGACDTITCATISIDNFDPDRIQAGFSGDKLFIHGMPPGGAPVRISLYDLLGKTIFKLQDFSQPEWTRTVYLPAAPYMLRIELEGFEKVFKLLKVH